MIAKAALFIALIAASAAGYFAWANGRLKADNEALTRSVVALTVEAEIAEAGRVIAAKEAAANAIRQAEAQTALEFLLTGEFDNADTPVDPAVIRVLDCLRDAESRPDCSTD